MFLHHVGLDEPAEYIIKIQGRLAEDFIRQGELADWFLGEVKFSIECGEGSEGPVSVLVGTVADQAALHGLLAKIRDLGVTLLYVDCVTAHPSPGPFPEGRGE